MNKVNNKVYIGQTSVDRSGYLGGGVFLRKALKKYGKSNFFRIILMDNISSVEELNSWEDFYIRLFNSRNPKVGYNVVPGGSRAGWKHRESAIEKIKERSNQEDNKLRIRQIQKLAMKAKLGSHLSKDAKFKMVKTKFGKVREIEVWNKEGEVVFTCNFSTEAEALTGIKKATIRNNLAGLSKTAGGYIFKYKNDN